MSDPLTHEVDISLPEGWLTLHVGLQFNDTNEPGENYEDALERYFKEIFKTAFPAAQFVSITRL